VLNPNYIVGFVDGEGCFSITFNKNGNRLPEVRLLFEIELREDDESILRDIQVTLGCGMIYRLDYARYAKWRPHVKYKVGNFTDIYDKIIPFFQRHPLQAKKRFDFVKFCQAAGLIKAKQHLTPQGIAKIYAMKHRDSLDALDAHVQWGATEIT
jgi:LAGLIDADG endonuclease